jgi:hypothetical protein
VRTRRADRRTGGRATDRGRSVSVLYRWERAGQRAAPGADNGSLSRCLQQRAASLEQPLSLDQPHPRPSHLQGPAGRGVDDGQSRLRPHSEALPAPAAVYVSGVCFKERESPCLLQGSSSQYVLEAVREAYLLQRQQPAARQQEVRCVQPVVDGLPQRLAV